MRRHTIAYLMHGARNVGGGERSIYALISGLERGLFEPVVFYANENEIIRRLREDGVRLVRIPLSDAITSVYRDSVGAGPVKLMARLYHLGAAVLMVRGELKRNNVDLLHPHDNLSKIIGAVAARLAGVKVVSHCRDLLTRGLVDRLLLNLQLFFMDAVIAVSESNRALFARRGVVPAKVRTIYNGIDLARFDSVAVSPGRRSLGLGDGTVVVGVVGVFDECKGHIHLFRAIQMLAGDRADFVCLVVGDGREGAGLKAFVSERGLQDRIHFLGYRQDAPCVIKEMDVVVMPSLQESFPRVALEAMAAGVPVIATDVGGLPESVEDGRTGIIVPPADPAALAAAIKRLIDDPALRAAMGAAGRKRVEERFSLAGNVRRTEELYLKLLAA